MSKIVKIAITKAYVRHYRDNGQTVAYVEWIDTRGKAGRTEGTPDNPHMRALFVRAAREGITPTNEVW
jgi:hypothetical protein